MQLNSINEVHHIKPLVCGNWHSHNSGTLGHPIADPSKDKCDTLGIANPDNVAFMVGHDKLLIGEDTGYHKNNAVWGYDMTSHSLTRIMTVPHGAETTGVYWHSDINGYAYIQNQVQHPSPESTYGRAGAIGYIKIKVAADNTPMPITAPIAPAITTKSDNELSGGAIAGIVVGVFAALGLGADIGYFAGSASGAAVSAPASSNEPVSGGAEQKGAVMP